MQRNNRRFLLGCLAVLAGVGVVWLERTLTVREVPGLEPGRTLTAEMDAGKMRSLLAERQDLDPQLVAMISLMSERIAALGESQEALARELNALREANLQMAQLAPEAVFEEQEVVAPDSAEAGSARRLPSGGRRARGLTESRLVEAGFTDFEASELIGRMDEIALERLNLRYQAARDGTLNTPAYQESVAELPAVRDVLEQEYGDDAYDRYLYASGSANRIVVSDVYQDSPAAESGLQPGDVVLEMADQRVYGTSDLMSIATQGSPGTTVPLVVRRDGALVQLYVPRGPLGIRARRGFENPAEP